MRRAAWFGMLAIFLFRLTLEFIGLPVAEFILVADIVTYHLPMLLVVGLGLVLAWRTLGTGVEHRFWGLVVIATALVLVGEGYWSWYAYTIDPHGPPIDSPHLLLFLVAAFLFLAIGVLMTRVGDEPLGRRLTLGLDVLIVMCVLYAAMFLIWTWPAFQSVSQRVVGATVAAVYPVFGSMLVAVMLAILIGWRDYRWRLWERLVAVSLGVYGTGLLAMPAWYPQFLTSEASSPPWFTWALGAGFYLLFIAMTYRITAEGAESLSERWPPVRLGGPSLARAYPVAAAVAMLLLGHQAVTLSAAPQGVPVMAATVTLAVLLGARSWFMEVERGYHRKSAVTDQATGVYSRRHLDARLESAIDAAGDGEVALTVFDIDGFSRFEDQDDARSVLIEVADILESMKGPSDEVFRLGADQFAMVSCATGEARAVSTAERATAAVRERVLERLGTLVGLSAGIAVYPMHAVDGPGLLQVAREACRSAKGALGGEVRVYGLHPGDAGVDELRGLSDSRARAGRDTVIVLAAAVDARDSVTRNHSAAVAELMAPLCRSLGLPEDRVHLASLAALVHDVGKIGVPDSVLRKLGPLTEEERLLIREHSELGERILAAARLHEILPFARHHHERWDGTGYPDGLTAHEIPFEARALAVCDTFETLIAGRPYQAARTVEEAIAEIEANAGSQFDPMIATVFVRMVRREMSLEQEGLGLGTVLRGAEATG